MNDDKIFQNGSLNWTDEVSLEWCNYYKGLLDFQYKFFFNGRQCENYFWMREENLYKEASIEITSIFRFMISSNVQYSMWSVTPGAR